METPVLQRMAMQVSRAVGASRILPVTGYVQLVHTGTRLELTATDAAVFATAVAEAPGEPGRIVVKAEPFLKLVGKTVTETMTLTVDGAELRIKGHGRYRQPAYTAEAFPVSRVAAWERRGTVDSALLKARFALAGCAVSKELIEPQLTGYWWGDRLVATDNMRCAIVELPWAMTPPVLVASGLADLIGQFLDDETVVVETGEHQMRLTSESLCLEGPELFGAERYPSVLAMEQRPPLASVTVATDALVEAVERVHLFADPLRSYGVELRVGDDVAVQAGETVERIGFEAASGEVRLVLNSDYWLRLLHACDVEAVTLSWRQDEEPLRMDPGPGVVLFLGTVAS